MSRLAQIRKDRGLTQDGLAAVSGVARITIARAESGRVMPSLQTLTRLCDALGVKIDDLIDRKAG